MCQPAAPHEMKRRSMWCHSVRRVPLPRASSSHRISPHSSTLGASARVTVVSNGEGAPTQVSFTLVPAVPKLPSTTKGAHSRSCAGSVSACQTFSGEWRSSRTRMSVHLSLSFCAPSFITCASRAGPGVYCSRSIIFFSLVRLVRQLRKLNEIAAGIVQHRDGRSGYVCGRHDELGAAPLDALVVSFDVIGEKHGRRLVLLKDSLLIRFGRRVVIQGELQLRAIRFLGRGHRQPATWAIAEIGLLGKSQYVRVKAQSFLLVVHV